MTPDRWSDLIGKLEDEGKIESHITEDLENRPGTAERVVVKTPMGSVRLSYTTAPRKLSQKAFYSKRGGSTMNVQSEYDENDIIHTFTVEREASPGRWVEIDAGAFTN